MQRAEQACLGRYLKKLPNLDLGIPGETEQKLGNKLVGSVKAGWLQYRCEITFGYKVPRI